MGNIIYYKSISRYCDCIDMDKRSAVILTKFQARLYGEMKRCHAKPLHGLAYFFDQIRFFWSLICILIFSRDLLLLEHFYNHNKSIDESIEFTNLEGGEVMLVFNPRAKEDFYFN